MKLFDLHADIGYDVMEEQAKGDFHVVKNTHAKKFDKGQIAYITMACFFEGKEDWAYMQDMILSLRKQIEECEDIDLVLSKEDLLNENGHKKAIMSVEGMCGIKDSPREKIRWMYDQGIRIASFCWNDENALATGVKGTSTRGLTNLGKEALDEMNKLHMIVDVSHANETTFWDIMNANPWQLISTHSNLRDLCDHPRNLWKKQAQAIAAQDGVIGVVCAPGFVSTKKEEQDIPHLVEHVKALKACIGIEHIAVGFDFMDFYDDANIYGAISDLANATQAQNFVDELYHQGFDESEIEQICFKNACNVVSKVYENRP